MRVDVDVVLDHAVRAHLELRQRRARVPRPRLRECGDAARLQHAAEFAQHVVGIRRVVEGVEADDPLDAGVGQIDAPPVELRETAARADRRSAAAARTDRARCAARSRRRRAGSRGSRAASGIATASRCRRRIRARSCPASSRNPCSSVATSIRIGGASSGLRTAWRGDAPIPSATRNTPRRSDSDRRSMCARSARERRSSRRARSRSPAGSASSPSAVARTTSAPARRRWRCSSPRACSKTT